MQSESSSIMNHLVRVVNQTCISLFHSDPILFFLDTCPTVLPTWYWFEFYSCTAVLARSWLCVRGASSISNSNIVSRHGRDSLRTLPYTPCSLEAIITAGPACHPINRLLVPQSANRWHGSFNLFVPGALRLQDRYHF